MEDRFLHCRTFDALPQELVVYEKKKEVPKTASEKSLDGSPEANRDLESLHARIETRVATSEIASETPTRARFQEVWKNATPQLRERLRPALDQMELGLRRLDVYQDVPKLEKDKAEVYAAAKQYEWAAERFNRESGSKLFPEDLTDRDWKKPGHATTEQRAIAFAEARKLYSALNINYTDNPKLAPAATAKPGENVVPVKLGFKEIEALAQGPVAQLRAIGAEMVTNPPKKVLDLTLEERTRLTSTVLSPGYDAIRENNAENNEHPLAMLKNYIILDTWHLYVDKLTGDSGAFDLKPDPNFGRVITRKPENRVPGNIFMLVPKDGKNPSPEEVKEAEECRRFLDANWKDVVFTFKDKPGVNLMQENPDVKNNNQDIKRIYENAKNSSELEAVKRQPFSRLIMSSPVGILLTVLGYFFLDSKDKEKLTKLLIGTFAFEKAGGLPGATAAYLQLKDQFPSIGTWLDDLTSGKLNVKAKEYTTSIFETWTGLSGIQKETRDWMFQDSDGLSMQKKMGIYIMVNDSMPVSDLKAKVDASRITPGAKGGIGDYITQSWQVNPGPGWWTGSGNPQKVKNMVETLARSTANKTAEGKKWIEEFMYSSIMGVKEQDVVKFFEKSIGASGKEKPNPMRETLDDPALGTKNFETALRIKYPNAGGTAAPTAATSSAPGATPAGAPGTGPATAPSGTAEKATEFKPEGMAFSCENYESDASYKANPKDNSTEEAFDLPGGLAKITYTTFSHPTTKQRFVTYQSSRAPDKVTIALLPDPKKPFKDQWKETAKAGNLSLTIPSNMKATVGESFGRILEIYNAKENTTKYAGPEHTNLEVLWGQVDYLLNKVTPAVPGNWVAADSALELPSDDIAKIASSDGGSGAYNNFTNLYLRPASIEPANVDYLIKVTMDKQHSWNNGSFVVTKTYTGAEPGHSRYEPIVVNGREVSQGFKSPAEMANNGFFKNFPGLFDAPLAPPTLPSTQPPVAPTAATSIENVPTDQEKKNSGALWDISEQFGIEIGKNVSASCINVIEHQEKKLYTIKFEAAQNVALTVESKGGTAYELTLWSVGDGGKRKITAIAANNPRDAATFTKLAQEITKEFSREIDFKPMDILKWDDSRKCYSLGKDTAGQEVFIKREANGDLKYTNQPDASGDPWLALDGYFKIQRTNSITGGGGGATTVSIIDRDYAAGRKNDAELAMWYLKDHKTVELPAHS